MSGSQRDVLHGAVELLALKALVLEPMHGWGIGQRIQQLSRGVLEVNQGSLYPALQRLEHRGMIKSEWGITESGRQARYYKLTASGRRELVEEQANWRRFAAAVEMVLSTP